MAPEDLGRFDRSFFVRAVATFLALLVAAAVLELGLRFAFTLHDFHVEDERATEEAAELLADDVRSIMLNEGGPVATRTLYPILQRNLDRSGLEIAILPSPVTVRSIERTFGYSPEGLSPRWPEEGRYHESVIPLTAEEACVGCHSDAAVGDVLGTVEVRSYLDRRLARWWDDVRLSATMNLVRIVVSVLILFFVLRVLLSPLLSLRAAISRLARGGTVDSTRAPVHSADEFGELADDLNVFLDRMEDLLEDFRRVLERLVRVTGRSGALLSTARRHLADLEEQVYPGRAPAASDPELVHRVHLVREAVEELTTTGERMREIAEDGERIFERLMSDDGGDRDLTDGEDPDPNGGEDPDLSDGGDRD